ncbi:MAG: hypothetical protein J7K51_03190 [Thermotogae bacterium]|nr:hypothetical protein [Thermotogota bacterium]
MKRFLFFYTILLCVITVVVVISRLRLSTYLWLFSNSPASYTAETHLIEVVFTGISMMLISFDIPISIYFRYQFGSFLLPMMYLATERNSSMVLECLLVYAGIYLIFRHRLDILLKMMSNVLALTLALPILRLLHETIAYQLLYPFPFDLRNFSVVLLFLLIYQMIFLILVKNRNFNIHIFLSLDMLFFTLVFVSIESVLALTSYFAYYAMHCTFMLPLTVTSLLFALVRQVYIRRYKEAMKELDYMKEYVKKK